MQQSPREEVFPGVYRVNGKLQIHIDEVLRHCGLPNNAKNRKAMANAMKAQVAKAAPHLLHTCKLWSPEEN